MTAQNTETDNPVAETNSSPEADLWALLCGVSRKLPAMGKPKTVVRTTSAAAALALLVAGCGTEAPQESAASSQTPAPTSTVDVSALDVGNYPTRPQPPLGTAGSEQAGRIVEGRRMADFVIGPWDVDPTLIEPYANTLVLKGPEALELVGPKAVAEAAGRHPFLTGFVSSRQSADKTILINGVVRYTDDAAAAAAATDMADSALAEPTSGATRTRVPVPGHDGTLTSAYPFTDPTVGREQFTVRSFTARGPYVLMQVAQSYNGLPAAVGMIGRALDAQAPLIDQFTPTPPADLAALPLDPSGLLARTLLVPAADATVIQNWAWGPRGALHFQTDPAQTAGLFSETGTDLVGTGKTAVYRTADGASAQKLADGLVNQVAAMQGSPTDPVDGLPDSTCVQAPAFGFYCVATGEQYAIEAQSTQKRDAHQLLAAQYALLVSD